MFESSVFNGKALGALLCGLCVLACDASTQAPADHPDGDADADSGADAAPPDGTAPVLPAAADGSPDLGGGALRVIEVPGASALPTVLVTPDGYFALSQRFLGDAKAPSGSETALYRSSDGVHWTRASLGRNDDALVAVGMAYGAGRYVITGWRLSQSGTALFASDDGETWSETLQELDYVERWGQVVFAGGRFFAFGARQLGVSEDGVRWQQVPTGIVQPFGLAFGNGRFVLVGSGGIQSSQDGLSWRSHAVDCDVPEACVTAPDGSRGAILFDVSFADGHFRAGPLASEDGETWTVADTPARGEPAGGYFFVVTSATELTAQSPAGETWSVPVVRPTAAAVTQAGRADTRIGVIDRDAPLLDQVTAEFEDGMTCADAVCLRIGRHLYLAPPPGTPALPDRVPRRADGEPLLSADCPASTMITCDDYEARTGCLCDGSAPSSPRACEHVGQFACAGAFSHRPDEWDVEEVGPAACHCDHRDPDAPASFGRACDGDTSPCDSPMACMEVTDPYASCCGPPGPPPRICTMACSRDADCPSWEGTGYCAGTVHLRCENGVCQQRSCE